MDLLLFPIMFTRIQGGRPIGLYGRCITAGPSPKPSILLHITLANKKFNAVSREVKVGHMLKNYP